MLSNPSSCAQCTLRPNKPKHRSLAQARKTGSSCSKSTNSPGFSGNRYYRQNLGVDLQGLWPSSDWLVVRVLFQKSQSSAIWVQPVWGPWAHIQSEVTVLSLGGGLRSCSRTQRYIVLYPLWGGTRTLLYHCTLVSWLLLCFFIHSLPWLVTVWICPLELGKVLGGWNLFPTNKKYFGGLPLWFSGKESSCHAGDPDLIPRSGISFGEGNGNPVRYSCQENSMDGGAWQATVHGVTKSMGTRLSN